MKQVAVMLAVIPNRELKNLLLSSQAPLYRSIASYFGVLGRATGGWVGGEGVVLMSTGEQG